MTMRTADAELRATDLVDISAEDAGRLQFHKGQWVRIHSRYVEAAVPIRITSSVKPGELSRHFTPQEYSLTNVTSPYRYGKSPEYKVAGCESKKNSCSSCCADMK